MDNNLSQEFIKEVLQAAGRLAVTAKSVLICKDLKELSSKITALEHTLQYYDDLIMNPKFESNNKDQKK